MAGLNTFLLRIKSCSKILELIDFCTAAGYLVSPNNWVLLEVVESQSMRETNLNKLLIQRFTKLHKYRVPDKIVICTRKMPSVMDRKMHSTHRQCLKKENLI